MVFPFGIAIANADSTQPQPKFGTVNALLGNVDHAAVDPKTGDLYYVYGNRDAATGNNRLAIRRITTQDSGNVIIGPEHFVTGQVQAAIPQVAVTKNGTIGVFYYTFDGFSSDNFPIFTAYLALSKNRGATFINNKLVTFLSSAQDNGDPRQRVLGDYMQMKALGELLLRVLHGQRCAIRTTVCKPRSDFLQDLLVSALTKQRWSWFARATSPAAGALVTAALGASLSRLRRARGARDYLANRSYQKRRRVAGPPEARCLTLP